MKKLIVILISSFICYQAQAQQVLGGTNGPTTAQQQVLADTAAKVDSITNNSIYIDQVGSNNTTVIEQGNTMNKVSGITTESAQLVGSNNDITIKQAVFQGRNNLVELSVQGSLNQIAAYQGSDKLGNSAGTDLGKNFASLEVQGNNNTMTTEQQRTGGTVGHYIQNKTVGDDNSVQVKQTSTGGSQKQVFSSIEGNNNTMNVTQSGTGRQYASVTMVGNDNVANVTQYGSMSNSANITLTNAGGPSTVNVEQGGMRNNTIMATCVQAGGCAPITVMP